MVLTPDAARRAVALLRLQIGSSYFTPGITGTVLGVDLRNDASLLFFTRIFAIRDAALGIGVLQAKDEELEKWLKLGILADSADLLALALGARKGLPRRTVAVSALLAGAAIFLGLQSLQEPT